MPLPFFAFASRVRVLIASHPIPPIYMGPPAPAPPCRFQSCIQPGAHFPEAEGPGPLFYIYLLASVYSRNRDYGQMVPARAFLRPRAQVRLPLLPVHLGGSRVRVGVSRKPHCENFFCHRHRKPRQHGPPYNASPRPSTNGKLLPMTIFGSSTNAQASVL